MTISFGSGQTSGLPLVITAITQGTGQTLHTCPVGSAVPNRIRIAALNLTAVEHILHVGIFDSGAALAASWQIAIPANIGFAGGLDPVADNLVTLPELVLNGTAVIKVWADTASALAVQARVDDQNGIAAVTAGSAQTNGLPLTLTAITEGTSQLVHTNPAGAATPNVVKLAAFNLDTAAKHTLHVGIYNSVAALIVQYQLDLPINEGVFPGVDQTNAIALVLDGTATIKCWADTASMIAVVANVNTQINGENGSGGGSSILASGLVAAVQNASRFSIGAQGGVGQATEANAQIMMPRAGTLSNLEAKSSAAVGGGATVTVAVRINGVSSGTLTMTLANADGTGIKEVLGSIAVAKGDLVDFLVSCDNAGAPAANIQASCQFT